MSTARPSGNACAAFLISSHLAAFQLWNAMVNAERVNLGALPLEALKFDTMRFDGGIA